MYYFFLSFFLLICSGLLGLSDAKAGTVVYSIQMSNPNNDFIVILVSTPNLKPSSSVIGDYDRVKLALAKEFNTGIRGYSSEKNAFLLNTQTTDPVKVAEIKARILKVVPDAVLKTVAQSEIQNLK